jgi:Arc/MetJ-type ribon-helix-helix transcriptional regulator
MCNMLMSLRMSPEMVAELKDLAKAESVRRGEFVSWAKLMRESAARTLKKAKRRAATSTATAVIAAQ